METVNFFNYMQILEELIQVVKNQGVRITRLEEIVNIWLSKTQTPLTLEEFQTGEYQRNNLEEE